MSVSAKHKRPFAVFAAVAVICGMVLVTGVSRSKAEPPHGPDYFSATVTDGGPPLAPLPEAEGSVAAGSGPQTDSGPQGEDQKAPRTTGSSDFVAPPSGGGEGDNDGSAEPDSGIAVVPPTFPLVPDPVDLDPGTDDESRPQDDEHGKSTRAKGHGHRDNDGKNHGKNDDESDDSGADDEPTDEGGHPTQPDGEQLDDELGVEPDVDVTDDLP
jgi:hypothetical protein